jgi:hypothetical protein
MLQFLSPDYEDQDRLEWKQWSGPYGLNTPQIQIFPAPIKLNYGEKAQRAGSH